LRGIGGINGAGGLGNAHIGNRANHIAPRGVGDIICSAIIGIHPFTGHKGFGGEQ
jgi:hypothetical protein